MWRQSRRMPNPWHSPMRANQRESPAPSRHAAGKWLGWPMPRQCQRTPSGPTCGVSHINAGKSLRNNQMRPSASMPSHCFACEGSALGSCTCLGVMACCASSCLATVSRVSVARISCSLVNARGGASGARESPVWCRWPAAARCKTMACGHFQRQINRQYEEAAAKFF